MGIVDRPPHLLPGEALGQQYLIEGLVRVTEGRLFYLAKPVNEPTDTEDTNGASLVSCRWDQDHYASYEKFFSLGLNHPGLAGAKNICEFKDQLWSVVEYEGEGLLLDEPSPLSNVRVVDLAQRLVGTVSFLHANGVQLQSLSSRNILICSDGTTKLFDLDVASVGEEPVGPADRGQELIAIGEVLLALCPMECLELRAFLQEMASGEFKDAMACGKALSQRLSHTVPIKTAVVHGAVTDVGLFRQLNEDNWGWTILPNGAKFYGVADGMGGHSSGEVASRMAIELLSDILQRDFPTAHHDSAVMSDFFAKSVREVNDSIKSHATSTGSDMGTTVVAALCLPNGQGWIANVGDSRAYILRENFLKKISEDHSLVQKMVDQGRLTEEQARTHPHSNILLRTVGTEFGIEVDVFPFQFQAADRLLLCSDGLWNEVSHGDLTAILMSCDSPRQACSELVRAAHMGGGRDNITLVIVDWASEPTS